MSEIIKILKNIGLIAVVILVLGILGAGINAVIPFQWLTSFFIIIRRTLSLIGWLIDLPTLFTIVGISFVIQLLHWGFKGTMTAINYLKK